MYDVARSFAKRSSGRGPSSFDEENDKQDGMYQQAPSPLGRNVVFLTWSIPDLFASNLFSLIPAYYKTVANYDLIMAHVTQTLLKLIEFVDEGNSVLFSRFKEVRARHFRKFHFYGHSLGSHILSDAILQVVSGRGPPVTPSSSSSASIRRDKNKALKFGKLVGLDPATPCFVSLAYGISSTKVSEAVNEVIVLHSNAGFAGVPNERTQLEIVLNGGTFQPGCSWWDFTCHHVRSTDILSYIDDSCQMVAYKCTSYHHFKRGACETCLNSDPLTSAKPSLNCLLVNLPEQHWDGRQVLTFAERFSNRTRQLAAALPFERDGLFKGNSDAILKPIELFRRLEELQLREELKVRQLLKNGSTSDGVVNQELEVNNNNEPKNQKKAFYHYVNTSPNFRFGRKSHCLQHYQLRLLIYHEDLSLKDKCKTSSFYIKSSSDVKLRLFYETATKKLPHKHRTRSRASDSLRFQARDSLEPKLVQDSQDPRVMSSKIKLNAIIKDVFYTALVNFEHEPKLFVGAHLDNLDLARMAECFRRENATSGPNFVLDIAFMSHTNQKIRHAFSSVLCSQLELNGKNNVKIESEDQDQTRYETDQPELLVLKLCKQSQLKNVSSQIDKLLNRIKLQRLEETWKVSLLNSLFSLFIEWEPF